MGVLFYSIICLFFNLSIVIVGSIYSDCNLGIILWLKVSGGISIGLNLLLIIWDCDEIRHRDPAYCLRLFEDAFVIVTTLSILIWGSVVTFVPYSTWTYDSNCKEDPNYCNYTPYTLAFVVLLKDWIIIAVLDLQWAFHRKVEHVSNHMNASVRSSL